MAIVLPQGRFNNSGEKIYRIADGDEGTYMLDDHHHLVAKHDLYNHDGLTEDGIAEAFEKFAKREGLSFFQ